MRPDETDNSYSDENKNTDDDNYGDDGNDGKDGNERNTGIQDLVFKPSRVVMIKELSDEQREQYYNLILANDVKLQYSDNQFVANIRLLGPTGNNNDKKKEKKTPRRSSLNSVSSVPTLAHPPGTIRKSSSALTLEKRVHRLQANTNMIPLTFEIEGVAAFDHSVFFRFCALIGKKMNSWCSDLDFIILCKLQDYCHCLMYLYTTAPHAIFFSFLDLTTSCCDRSQGDNLAYYYCILISRDGNLS